MTLRASLLRQLENPALNPSERAELRCEIARELEQAGDYGAACEALGELWAGVGERPRLEGLDQRATAEVLLRAGVLTGWLGGINQINDAQEAAKNLIGESVRLFEAINHDKRVLEGQTEQAYCYWREGAYDEARIILKDVLARLTTDSELRAKAVMRSAIVERGARRYHDALRILIDSAPLFDKISNHTVKGGYYNELAIVLRNLGTSEGRTDYADRAFVEYAAASYHFEQAGHKNYCANVENNLAFLYFEAGKYEEAPAHLDHARRLLVSLKDTIHVAQVDETRARVMLAQGRYAEAERVAFHAVRALEQSGRQSLLAEALTTHGAAQARLGHHEQARLTLMRAMELAHQAGALSDAAHAALTFIEELGEHLTAGEAHASYERADDWLGATDHAPTLQRLRQAARVVLRALRQEGETKAPELSRGLKRTMREVVLRYEREYITRALDSAEGSITQAARLLGISYQSLAYMLQHKHKDLLPKRTPIVRRRRSS